MCELHHNIKKSVLLMFFLFTLLILFVTQYYVLEFLVQFKLVYLFLTRLPSMNGVILLYYSIYQSLMALFQIFMRYYFPNLEIFCQKIIKLINTVCFCSNNSISYLQTYVYILEWWLILLHDCDFGVSL